MIAVSDNFKNACNSDTYSYREYIIITGTSTPIDVKAELYETAYKDTHFIGTFNINYIKFKTENDVQYRNREFDYFKEVNGEPIKIGHFIVTETANNDTTEEVSVTAYDNGIKFAMPYKTDLDYQSGRVTLLQVLQECCSKCGVGLVNQSIDNGNFIVDSNQFVNGEQFGDVVSAVAFISGNFATINNDGNLKLLFGTDTDEIIEDYVELEDKRDTHPITSVSLGVSNIAGENVVMKDNDLIRQYGERWLIINDCPFAYTQLKRQQLITAIFNKVKGFGYSSFTSKYAFKPYYELGDRIQFRNKEGNLVSSIILRLESRYDDITLSAPSVTNATVEYEQPVDAIELGKRSEIINNKQEQRITSIISTQTEQRSQISQMQQDIDSIEAQIGDIADITEQKEGAYQLEFENTVADSLPIMLKIHPTIEDISYLYPSAFLFPSSTTFLKVRKLLIVSGIGTENENTYDYNLPCDLLFLGDVYDEFIIDEENLRCYKIKRIGINANGEKYVLSTPDEISYEKPNFILEDGRTTFTLVGYPNSYLYGRCMSNNIYTNQFATKVELSSGLAMTTDSINAHVAEEITRVDGRIDSTNSQLALKADAASLSVYATKSEVDTAKAQAINTSDAHTDNKLEDYVTTIDMNSALSLKADTATLGSYYTKTQTNNTFSTKAELETGITTATEDATEAAIDEVSNNVVSYLNASADTITLRGGSSIYLNTAGKLVMTAGNFKLDEGGNVQARNGDFAGKITSDDATITGGDITLYSDGSNSKLTIYRDGDNSTYNWNSSNSWRMVKSGNVLIQATTLVNSPVLGVGNIDALGSVTSVTPTGVVTNSDKRLKENIETIDKETSINVINELRPVTYNFIKNKGYIHRGLIAQEVEKALKHNGIKEQIYNKDDQGYYSLNYNEFIPDLINSIQYLTDKIKLMEDKMANLEKLIANDKIEKESEK